MPWDGRYLEFNGVRYDDFDSSRRVYCEIFGDAVKTRRKSRREKGLKVAESLSMRR